MPASGRSALPTGQHMASTVVNPASRANASTPPRSSSGSMADTNPSFIDAAWMGSRADADPLPAAVARRDRLAEEKLAMAVGERRVERLRRTPAGPDVVVDRAEALLEGIGEALVVAAREIGEGCRGGAEERRVAHEQVVGRRALADPELVRRLAVPCERAFRAGDLVAEAVLAAGGHLGNRQGSLRPALETQKRRAVAPRGDADGLPAPGC